MQEPLKTFRCRKDDIKQVPLEDPQIWGATIQNWVNWTSWYPGFVHPWTKRIDSLKTVTYYIKVLVSLSDFGTLMFTAVTCCRDPLHKNLSYHCSVCSSHVYFNLELIISSFILMTKLLTEWFGNYGWIPDRTRYFSVHHCSYQFWSPPSLISSGNCSYVVSVSFSLKAQISRDMKLVTHLHTSVYLHGMLSTETAFPSAYL